MTERKRRAPRGGRGGRSETGMKRREREREGERENGTKGRECVWKERAGGVCVCVCVCVSGRERE